MILENLGLTEKGINYLTTISYRFTSGNIYGLIGDTSVNVLARVLCGLIKEATGKRILDHQENISFFLNDMQFLEDFNILETIEDIDLLRFIENSIDIKFIDISISVIVLKTQQVMINVKISSTLNRMNLA